MQNVSKWVFSQLRICRPLPFPSLVLIRILWMMWSVLNIMKNEINLSSNSYFSSYYEKFIKNFPRWNFLGWNLPVSDLTMRKKDSRLSIKDTRVTITFVTFLLATACSNRWRVPIHCLTAWMDVFDWSHFFLVKKWENQVIVLMIMLTRSSDLSNQYDTLVHMLFKNNHSATIQKKNMIA